MSKKKSRTVTDAGQREKVDYLGCCDGGGGAAPCG